MKNPKSCDQIRPTSIPNLSKVAETFHTPQADVTGFSFSWPISERMLERKQYNCLLSDNVSSYCRVAWPRKCDCWSSSGLLKSLWPYSPFQSCDKFTRNGCTQAFSSFSDWFFCKTVSSVYSLFPEHANSKWAALTCSAPQRTKLAALLFSAIINFVLSDFWDKFKYVDNLSVLMKYLTENFKAVPQFSDAIMSNSIDRCTINSLQRRKILCFNPPKRDFVSLPPPYPSVSSEVTLGATLSVDCSFNTHVDIISIKANGAMRTLILLRRSSFSVSELKTA